VDPKNGLCQCPAAMRGRFCKHAALVVKYKNAAFLGGPVITEEDKEMLAFLALGDDMPNGNFFLGKTQPARDAEASKSF
jgi:hypothetical protein